MSRVIFRDAKLFDGWTEADSDRVHVLVEDGFIKEISDQTFGAPDAEIVDCRGRTLMPGMIDAHVHVYAASLDMARGSRLGPSYLAHYAHAFLRSALDSGFTAVRDVGGGDRGLAMAIGDALLPAPRFFYGGRAVSQTGGHGDYRSPDQAAHGAACGCAFQSDFGLAIADGVDQLRGVVREELRRGAHHIKIMGSGGVTSPTDPVDRCQYSDEEIKVVVEETARAGVYTAAHCHPGVAIRRSIELGVRSIEHATLIDEATAALAVARGAFLVPTLSIIFTLLEKGVALGLSPASMEKLRDIGSHALSGLEIMWRAGTQIGFGTDLIGPLYPERGSEFLLRRQVMPSIDILRSACAVNAELLQQGEKIGRVVVGAHADLLVVDGDPLADIALLAQGGAHLPVIMKAGRFHKRSL